MLCDSRGFHMLMSYMGAIAGSCLKQLFDLIYAQNSVDKVMSGMAYAARSVFCSCPIHYGKYFLFWRRERCDQNCTYKRWQNCCSQSRWNWSCLSFHYKIKKAVMKLENHAPTAVGTTWIKQFIYWGSKIRKLESSYYFHSTNVALFPCSRTLFLCKVCPSIYTGHAELKDKMDLIEYEKFTRMFYN